ncbi:MAG: UDP-3-O-(3-hydroxymyristoyl)glucosamine N-acyltransferase [Saprospiraceae bacterium]|nr:UDP-3-O-(3-hydroxymyristoyl)glucosamine N-acyltransferase [Saprospiraceae bacterium]
MKITVAMIAQFVQGEIEGDPNLEITGPARIEEGQAGTISFLADARYEEHAYTTGSTALLVHRTFQPKTPIQATLIRVENVRQAVAQLLSQFEQKPKAEGIVSPQACVDASARLGEGVQVGRFTIVEKNATIGAGSYIHDQVYVGPGVTLGERCILFPGVRIYKDCVLGDDCVIHSNTVIGADGFGFAPQPDGSYVKIPQVGKVSIGNKVEIGANCTIDRATMGETVIEDGVKLDNLIHIAHNVRIGAHTVMASQVGVAGSTKVGKHCQIGGQVGISGHIEIADGVKIQAQSGIATAITEPGQAVFGSPAIGYNQYIKSYSVFKNLPELDKRLRRLEKKME